MAPNNNNSIMTGQQASLDTIAALAGVVSASSSAAHAVEAVHNNSTTNDNDNNQDDDNQRLQSTNSTDYYAKGSAELATESALTLAKIQHVSYIILYYFDGWIFYICTHVMCFGKKIVSVCDVYLLILILRGVVEYVCKDICCLSHIHTESLTIYFLTPKFSLSKHKNRDYV